MWKPVKWLGISFLLAILAVTACLVLLTDQSQAQTGVLCVVPPGEPTGPFAACEHVFTAVQDAVDTAVAGEEILVASGVYTDVHTRMGTTQTIFLDKDIAIRGGYLPPFDQPPNPELNVSLLDAQQQGRVVFVVTDTVASLSGLQLTGGDASGNSNGWGGGVYALSATVTLSNNVIFSNTAAQDLVAGFGGGVAAVNGQITLFNNHIHHNIANTQNHGAGGGVAIFGGEFFVEGNAIVSNTAAITLTSLAAGGFGGGLAIGDSHGQFANNSVVGNVALENGGGFQSSAGWGGGMYLEKYIDSSTPIHVMMEGNLFEKNTALANQVGSFEASGFGGGLLVNNFSYLQNTFTLTMTKNTVRQNIAAYEGADGLGGGLYIRSNQERGYLFIFKENEVTENVVVAYPEEPLVYAHGGGLMVQQVDALLSDNLILSNTTSLSGTHGTAAGVYFVDSLVEQTNDVVRSNTAVFTNTGGILYERSMATLNNVVVADNVGTGIQILSSELTMNHPTLARNQGSSAIMITGTLSSNLTMTNGIIVSHSTGISMAGFNEALVRGVLWYNTAVPVDTSAGGYVSVTHDYVGNPLFAPDGYHIQEGSAAIGRGVPSGVLLDIDGEARPPANAALGADEFWPFKLYYPFTQRN